MKRKSLGRYFSVLLFCSSSLFLPAAETLAELIAKARAGDANAAFRVGMCYANGDGVAKDLVQAATFYGQAAIHGIVEAQFNLAEMYLAGDGVPKDLVLAHVWWNVCGATGNKSAKQKLATIEPQMTPEQKAQAMALARETFAAIQKSKAAPPRNAAPTTEKFADPARSSKSEVQGPIRKTQKVRPVILAERPAGTANIGPTAIDARWSNYGAHLHRMMESVQFQWERLLTENKVYPASGSTVTVKFVMDSKGLIARIVNVDSTAGELASRACVTAIMGRAPYGDWNADMIAVLGEQQEMTFTFYYQ